MHAALQVQCCFVHDCSRRNTKQEKNCFAFFPFCWAEAADSADVRVHSWEANRDADSRVGMMWKIMENYPRNPTIQCSQQVDKNIKRCHSFFLFLLFQLTRTLYLCRVQAPALDEIHTFTT